MKLKCAAGLFLTSSALVLAACGGGGGDSTPLATAVPVTAAPTPAPAPAPAPTGNSWVQGRFAPASGFKDLCETPRQGSDAQGTPFPDIQGTLSDELFWLRSWSDETYLWYNEITDRNPNDFSDRLAYFDELKTEAVTATGAAKDRFHFTYDTAEWLQIRTSGSSSGYGAELTLLSSAPPRDIRVAYVEPNSPASTAGLQRGDKVLTVNGVDAVNGSDVATLNAGLFPSQNGQTYSFGIERVDGTTGTVALTSAQVVSAPVNTLRIVEQNSRRYGYVHFTTFSPRTAEEQLFDAFDTLQAGNIDDLVLDLRYNGGGLLAIASQLSYMVAGPAQTNGKWFETLQFNNKANGINPVTGEAIRPTPFYQTGVGFTVPSSRPTPSVSKPRVFVLTSAGSCSASEAVMNGLRGVDVEVIQIGSRTCGKPYGFYGTDNCGVTYFTIQFRGVNFKNFGDYADGFAPGESPGGTQTAIPGCAVSDDFSKSLGDPTEAKFAAAIAYAETGNCPTAARLEVAERLTFVGTTDPALDLLNDPRIQALEAARTLPKLKLAGPAR